MHQHLNCFSLFKEPQKCRLATSNVALHAHLYTIHGKSTIIHHQSQSKSLLKFLLCGTVLQAQYMLRQFFQSVTLVHCIDTAQLFTLYDSPTILVFLAPNVVMKF